ncbi:MAG: epoxyqueuosine reductase QueH, partial [Kiritimatiellae bacterium]|nr:epoxyqueuosine reductase QueH [Kiritimatiellia bacterium]
MTVALHVCCGPCASACVPRLKDAGRAVTMLFANSNIDTREEFERRRDAARRLAEHDGVAFVSLPYDHADWLEKVARGFEGEAERGARCARCYRYSLAQVARWARAHGVEAFTTSLTVSPHKPSAVVFAAGREA